MSKSLFTGDIHAAITAKFQKNDSRRAKVIFRRILKKINTLEGLLSDFGCFENKFFKYARFRACSPIFPAVHHLRASVHFIKVSVQKYLHLFIRDDHLFTFGKHLSVVGSHLSTEDCICHVSESTCQPKIASVRIAESIFSPIIVSFQLPKASFQKLLRRFTCRMYRFIVRSRRFKNTCTFSEISASFQIPKTPVK